MIKRMLGMLLVVGVLFGGIFGYKAFIGHLIKKSLSTQQAPPVTVATIKARLETWEPRIDAVGSVRASQGVAVTTEIAGQVDAVLFRSGEDAQSGQVLVRLKAEADTALLRSLEAEAELANSTFERDKRQFAVEAISQANLDVARADLKSRQAQVAQQSAMLEKKTIRAPFAGRIGISTVAPGQYLNPGDHIVTLQAIDSVYVDFYLPQQEIARIAMAQPVTVTSNTYPDRPLQGRISAISPVVDPQTRNIQVEATLDNPDHELLPGMFVTATVQTGEKLQHITLPQTAVTYNPYGETVFIVQQGSETQQGGAQMVAKQTFVTTGPTRGDQVAILDGVKAGDTVVTGGQLKLKSGSVVIVNNDIQPSNEANPAPMDP